MSDICLICTLPIKKKYLNMIECNHTYHKNCLNKWIKIKPICPYCSYIIISTFNINLIKTDKIKYKSICIVSRERLRITSKKNTVLYDIIVSNIKNFFFNKKKNLLTITYYENDIESYLFLKAKSKVIYKLFNTLKTVFIY